MDIIVPFVTGLTTGGLSCLAVQGCLLASSVASEVEQSVREQPQRPLKKQGKATQQRSKARRAQTATPAAAVPARQPRAARPIVLFLGAKLVAYTILGFFLGSLGSVLQLSLF